MSKMNQFFSKTLLEWHFNHNERKLPWKEEKNPYKIWLSEIILQQTRAAQGLSYYHKFLEQFPTINNLASASLNEVLLLWEGLGYYSRARNLHHAAKTVVNEYNGKFPAQYEAILSLKGVGPYTAAAIASFAYNLPHAVVDGNVIRLLSRFFGIHEPFDTAAGKKKFQQKADEVLVASQAAKFNQAIMDFGATVCTPSNPKCDECHLSIHCKAKHHQWQQTLPIKQKKLKVKKRYFNYFIFQNENKLYIEQRTQTDIWQGLFQFPLIETQQLVTEPKKLSTLLHQEMGLSVNIKKTHIVRLKQRLTHQEIHANFIKVTLSAPLTNKVDVELENLRNFAFPRIINLYLEQNIATFK